MKFRAFIDRHFSITRTRRSTIAAAIVTALLLAVVLIFTGSYLEERTVLRVLLFIGCVIAPFIIGLLIAFRIEWKQNIAKQCFNTALFFLLPVVTVTMTEALNGIFVYDMTYFGFAANYGLTLLLQGLIYAISGSYRLPILILNPILFAMGVVNFFMMQYRGTPFVPMDFLSLGVADAILEQYEYRVDFAVITALLLLAFLIVVGMRLKTPDFRLITRIIARAATGVIFVTIMLTFFFTSFFAQFGVKPDFWNQARGYRYFGFTYSFFINTKYLYVLEPSGYDATKVDDYIAEALEDEEEPLVSDIQPDVICIMNEALSDLSVLGEVNTNVDPLPFISSLSENTVRGNLYVPVIGAGTANTEFEFLTGNSMAFLPSGSNAYILYANRQLHALPTWLGGQGYAINYMHPYYAGGWNRDIVHTNLGFPDFISIEDMLDMNIFREYQQNGYDVDYLQQLMEQAYPGEDILLRQYVKDSYNYEKIIENYENRDTSQPYFMFNVTMQNHGAYRADAENFEQNIWLTDTDEYDDTNRYLSMLQYSDDAFRDLVAYFETVDRPVIICMFGDHQPAIETAFVEETLGSSINDLTLEQQQARHVTPFLIWANYDIEEAEYEALSSNYLSSLVLKTAGLEMSDYNRYLLKLSETLPIIDTVGYMDAEGNHYDWNASSPYTGMLEQYKRIQYNGLLDKKNRNDAIFSVN